MEHLPPHRCPRCNPHRRTNLHPAAALPVPPVERTVERTVECKVERTVECTTRITKSAGKTDRVKKGTVSAGTTPHWSTGPNRHTTQSNLLLLHTSPPILRTSNGARLSQCTLLFSLLLPLDVVGGHEKEIPHEHTHLIVLCCTRTLPRRLLISFPPHVVCCHGPDDPCMPASLIFPNTARENERGGDCVRLRVRMRVCGCAGVRVCGCAGAGAGAGACMDVRVSERERARERERERKGV